MRVPRREATVLVRVAVDGVLEQVAADPAVVEQRVALTGAPYPTTRLPSARQSSRNLKELVADRLGPRAQLQIAIHVMQPGCLLDPQYVVDAFARRAGAFLGTCPHPNRTAVRRDHFDVDHLEAGGGQRTHRRKHRVVLKMLVVDRVELAETDEVQGMVHLDAQPAVVGQQPA